MLAGITIVWGELFLFIQLEQAQQKLNELSSIMGVIVRNKEDSLSDTDLSRYSRWWFWFGWEWISKSLFMIIRIVYWVGLINIVMEIIFIVIVTLRIVSDSDAERRLKVGKVLGVSFCNNGTDTQMFVRVRIEKIRNQIRWKKWLTNRVNESSVLDNYELQMESRVRCALVVNLMQLLFWEFGIRELV